MIEKSIGGDIMVLATLNLIFAQALVDERPRFAVIIIEYLFLGLWPLDAWAWRI